MLKPIFLWSDVLVFALLVLLVGYIYFGIKHSEVRERWARVYVKSSRIVASLVLLVFIVIGALDSIHFIPATTSGNENITSVLDVLLWPISSQSEKTYSAPFARQLFVAQMQKTDDNISWTTEGLEHIAPTSIADCILHALWQTLLAMFIFSMLFWIIYKRNASLKISLRPWIVAGISCAILLFVIFSCMQLIAHYHILGTDKIGTDVFYASVKSVRTGLIIGILTTILTMPFAVLLGAMAGYFRGWVDDIIQYLYTTLSSIPGVLLIAAAMLSLEAVISRHEQLFTSMAQRADARLLLLCAILGITSWTTLCRILRGETLKLRDQEFILASRAMGLNSMQIIARHIIPDLMHIILIALILDFSGLVLAEAVLSYVGVGVDASTFSWGNMINGARMEMGRSPVIWWSLAGAFIMMFTLVLAANIFADGVRDAFDPQAE